MFAKSKRFPEAGKDYIPGPGEYDVSNDDSSRHKRYGFLTQTNRFSENQHHDTPESSEFYISTNHDGTTTESSIASISSDTRASSASSNRTADDTMTISGKSNTKKLPSSPTEASNNQFEKYRYTMQKEMEALQAKVKKMESTIHSLEVEKSDTKATLLSNDLELADLRSKNATLQKTINRQEKSSKTAQLQKKVEHLEEQLTLLQNRHEKESQDKNQVIEQYQADLNRSNSLIAKLEHSQQEQKIAYEALEAQAASLTIQLSEFNNNATECEIKMNQLQQDLQHLKNTNNTLMQDLDACLNETQSLKTLNKELVTRLQARQENISQLESRITLKDEEIDALLNTIDERDRIIEDKSTLIEKLQTQFQKYRHWMDHTVVPHLRAQRTAAQNHYYTELNQLLTELNEAKKFMNRQAQYLDGFKSDVHWLTVQNQQLTDIVSALSKERTEQHDLNSKIMFGTKVSSNKSSSGSNSIKKHPNQRNKQTVAAKAPVVIKDYVSDTTVSFSSKSTISDNDKEHKQQHQHQQRDTPSPTMDSNVMVLNDSGFGILVDEAK